MANEYCAKVSYEDKTLIDLTKDTVSATYVMSGKKFHDNSGAPVTGTMPTRGSGSASISTKSQTVNLQYGYYDGSGRVSIDSAEQAKIIAENIKKDVTILGVTGTHEGGGSYEEETLPSGGTWAKIDCDDTPVPTTAGVYLGNWPSSFTTSGLKVYDHVTKGEVTEKYHKFSSYSGQTNSNIRVDSAGSADYNWYRSHVEIVGTPVGHSNPYLFEPTFSEYAGWGWVMSVNCHSDTYGDYVVIVNFKE